MSPLLGSSGGSSEYAFRGTLDDWPNAFDTVLSAQNLTGQNPGTTVTATLTVGGINYKARLTVDYPNTTVSINGGAPVSAKDADPEVFVRDNDIITINFEIPLTSAFSFNTLHVISVKLGKRSGTWSIGTRPIDATPNTFSFTSQTGVELSTLVTSNTVTISGLEPNFDFDLSVGAGVTYYKNGVISTSSTITNNDTLYLETISPSLFNTLRSYTVSVGGISSFGISGGISTTWTITSRDGDGIPDQFTFNDIVNANDLGGIYTSNPITVSGIDAGPLGDPEAPDYSPFADITAVPVYLNSSGGFIIGYEIRKSDGSLRYLDPSDPGALEYFQDNRKDVDPLTETNFAYLGDTIRLRMLAPGNYSGGNAFALILGYGDTLPPLVSDTWNIYSRPAPINTIPSATGFSFTALTDQDRDAVVSSNPITLSGMTPGYVGIASISLATAGIEPAFQVSRGGIIVRPYSSTEPTFDVQNGDEITLRMRTPNPPQDRGVISSSIVFQVSGTNTELNDPSRVGFTTSFGTRESDPWSVTTKERSCGPINTFSFADLTGVNAVNTNFDVVRTFTPSGFEVDCNMSAIITSDSLNYNFTGRGSPIAAIIPPVQTLTNIIPGEPIEVTVRSSNDFTGIVTAAVQITNNPPNPATPNESYTSPVWTIQSQGNNTPASVTLTSNPTSQEVNQTVELTWTSTNVVEFRSASWTTSTLVSTGTSTLTMPAAVPVGGTITYNISFFANTSASNYAGLSSEGGRGYVQASTTVTVLNDLSAIFTPNNFTNVTVPCIDDGGTTPITSNSITISGITGIITGTLGETGTLSSLNAGSFNTDVKDFNNNSIVRLRIPNNQEFLNGTSPSTRVGTINFSEGNGTKTFTVTASPCVPQEQDIVYNNATVPPIINSLTVTTCVPSRPVTIVYFEPAGVEQFQSDYITKLPTGTGTFTGWISDSGSVGQRFDGSTSDITWSEALEALFRIYNKEFWRTSTGTNTDPGFHRNPTFAEINGFTGTLFALNTTLAQPVVDRGPITNVTEWIDAFITARPTGPGATLRAVSFTMTSRTTGLNNTGLAFDFCNNPIPLVFPDA